MPARMLPMGCGVSLTRPLRGVDVEIPAVVGRGELVGVLLLDPGGVASLQVVADRGLDLARRRVETQAEDAGADIRVEAPRRHVHSAALAQEGGCVAVGGEGDLGRAEV